eukprot:10181959-Lingulodinium_polyedra.AAC.1
MAARKCFNCHEDCDPEDLRPWGRSGVTCLKCKSNYNRITEKCRQSRDLKTWWLGLSTSERAAWYQKNKQLKKYERKNFDSS